MYFTTRLTCVFTLGTAALLAQTATPVTVLKTTGMIGIATGQTGRLNLLNPGSPTATAAGCTASVQFLDGGGTVLKTASVTVAPGKSMPVEIHSDTDVSLAPDTRKDIRATISVPGVPPASTGGAPTPSCTLIPTLEIYDSITGRTEAIIGRAVTADQ